MDPGRGVGRFWAGSVLNSRAGPVEEYTGKLWRLELGGVRQGGCRRPARQRCCRESPEHSRLLQRRRLFLSVRIVRLAANVAAAACHLRPAGVGGATSNLSTVYSTPHRLARPLREGVSKVDQIWSLQMNQRCEPGQRQ